MFILVLAYYYFVVTPSAGLMAPAQLPAPELHVIAFNVVYLHAINP